VVVQSIRPTTPRSLAVRSGGRSRLLCCSKPVPLHTRSPLCASPVRPSLPTTTQSESAWLLGATTAPVASMIPPCQDTSGVSRHPPDQKENARERLFLRAVSCNGGHKAAEASPSCVFTARKPRPVTMSATPVQRVGASDAPSAATAPRRFWNIRPDGEGSTGPSQGDGSSRSRAASFSVTSPRPGRSAPAKGRP